MYDLPATHQTFGHIFTAKVQKLLFRSFWSKLCTASPLDSGTEQ